MAGCSLSIARTSTEMASASSAPLSVHQVLRNYCCRRHAILCALTSDADKFYQMCDPDGDDLSLFGLPNGQWEVRVPDEDVPPELPEPAVGINHARPMGRKEWLLLVAKYSDSWLLSVAFFLAADLNPKDRKRLFCLINALPTVYKELLRKWKQAEISEIKSKQAKNNSGRESKPKQSMKESTSCEIKANAKSANEDDAVDVDEQVDTMCGACHGGHISELGEFWIACDKCNVWYHGVCVKITAEQAENIKKYKCPSCSSKKRKELTCFTSVTQMKSS